MSPLTDFATLQQIDGEIARLKSLNPLGTETEVYSRVVGYFRNIKNWNDGKKQEEKERVMFDVVKKGA